MLAIYKNSRNSAWQNHEEDLWLSSKRENINCKNAIDTAIKENYDGKRLDVKGAKKVLAQYGYDRTMWVLATSVCLKDSDGRFSRENKDWAKSVIPSYLPKDELRSYASDYHAVLDGFVNQVRREYAGLELVGIKQCQKSDSPQDYEKKLLILKPEVLSDQFKTPVNQYFYATGGFGCSPEKSGKKVFGEFLSDGESDLST